MLLAASITQQFYTGDSRTRGNNLMLVLYKKKIKNTAFDKQQMWKQFSIEPDDRNNLMSLSNESKTIIEA